MLDFSGVFSNSYSGNMSIGFQHRLHIEMWKVTHSFGPYSSVLTNGIETEGVVLAGLSLGRRSYGGSITGERPRMDTQGAAESAAGTPCPLLPWINTRHENMQQFRLLCKVHYIKFILNDNINANIALQWFPRYTVSYHINIVWHSYNGQCFRRHTKPTAFVNYLGNDI